MRIGLIFLISSFLVLGGQITGRYCSNTNAAAPLIATGNNSAIVSGPATNATSSPGMAWPRSPQKTSHAANHSSTALRRSNRVTILVWSVVAATLALIGLIITFSFMRAARRLLLGRDAGHQKTPYIDAWKLAGKRLRTPAAEARGDDLSDPPDP